MVREKVCKHLEAAREVEPSGTGCMECLALGETWRHLRLCMTCGHVGCCDSSTHRHATQHFEEMGHAAIKSFEPGEDWGWCFVDELFVRRVGVNVGKDWRGGIGD